MNAIAKLLRDHEPLAEGVRHMGALLACMRQGELDSPARHRELVETIEHLRDKLFEHFGVEEEVLFPFLRAEIPEVAPTVGRLESDHDRICGALLRIEHLVAGAGAIRGAAVERIAHIFERFEVAYQNHARAESELLLRVEPSLGPTREQLLVELVRGLG